jgi:aminopeptidase N
MMQMRCRTICAILLVLSVSWPALSQTSESGVDVLNYSAVIRPNINARSVSGEVNIHLQFTDGTVVHRWHQTEPVSTCLFGFAAGRFTETESTRGTTAFRYSAENMSRDELNRVFVDTPDMVDFFIEHAGVALRGSTYTQVLVANTAGQETAGFSMLSDAYVRAVLNDPTAISPIAHELAHQWWGNLVTCRDWTHF